MSMIDVMDDVLLGADDDELDYDLEKDEEEALLADPDNYDDQYNGINEPDQHLTEQYEEPVTNEEDVLDIDSNVHLDETEEDLGEQHELQDIQLEESNTIPQQEDDVSDQEADGQKERNRFLNERIQNVHRPTSNEIPDTLDKVTVQPLVNTNNNQKRFQQRNNRGRGRGRQNFNRGSVFGRVGHLQAEGGKTVHINPHFRGNVQVNENARLVWDANVHNNPMMSQQRYPNTQMAQVAPFQSQPSPWLNPPYPEQNQSFNHNPPPMQQNFQEPPIPVQYNHPPEIGNLGIRPLIPVNNQQPPYLNQQPPPPQQQGNFRGRDGRFNNNTTIQPLMMNNPPPNFNQQGPSYQGRNNSNNFNQQQQRRPGFVNQPHPINPPPLVQLPQTYPSHFEQPPPPFNNQNQFPQNQPIQNQNFQPQSFNQQPNYEPYNNQMQFNNSNQFTPATQFQPPIQNNNQSFPHQTFPPQSNYEPNFIPNQQEQFQPQRQQYTTANNRQFNHNRMNNPQRLNRQNFNNVNRSPPKRRSFENNQEPGNRDLPKKKKRSMELSNLHEVPTVDMPDTTTEDKNESEDEETKAYRKKIEEQKKLREKILREKEERRKLAAAQKVEVSANASDTLAGGDSLLTTLKTKPANISNIQTISQQKVVNKPQVQQMKQIPQKQPFNQNQQQRPLLQQHPQQQYQQQYYHQQQHYQQPQQQFHQQQQQMQRPQQLSTIRPNQPPQQKHFQQQGVNRIPVQSSQPHNNQQRIIQRRVNQNQQANIVITQKSEQQSQRIVMLKQNQTQAANANRRVVLKGMNNTEIVTTNSEGVANEESPNSGNLSSFLTNRKVIANSVVAPAEKINIDNITQGALIETPIVVVSNLAAGTTDVKIRKLCQGLGPIQNIQMIPNSRQATIRFKNIVSAHKFFKKYQRKIVDLSMIHVSLEAES